MVKVLFARRFYVNGADKKMGEFRYGPVDVPIVPVAGTLVALKDGWAPDRVDHVTLTVETGEIFVTLVPLKTDRDWEHIRSQAIAEGWEILGA
jgi:hypothetical protein